MLFVYAGHIICNVFVDHACICLNVIDVDYNVRISNYAVIVAGTFAA